MVRGLSCPVACGILVPQPGIEPASPALEGGFFTTGPPGKSLISIINLLLYICPHILFFPSLWRTLTNTEGDGERG